MDSKRSYETAVKIHDAAFQILDEIPELNGDTAGTIAKAVQDAAEARLRQHDELSVAARRVVDAAFGHGSWDDLKQAIGDLGDVLDSRSR